MVRVVHKFGESVSQHITSLNYNPTKKMNNNDGYSTPIAFPSNEDASPHGPLSAPSTPRHRKPTIGVKRMPSHLAIPTLDELDLCCDMMNPANDNGLPSNLHSLKPRTELPTLSYRPSFLSTTTNVVLVEAVVASSNKRQRRHDHHPSRCSIRTSLSPINSNIHIPRKSSRSDSCDW